MANSINNKIPFVPENTIDPAAGLNLSLNTIDALLQVLVQTVGANTPPAGVEGARHIVGTAPTGAWAGQANKLARYLDSAWQFFDARYVLNAADGLFYMRVATTWSVLASAPSLSAVQSFAGNKTLALADVNTYNVSSDTTAQTITIPAQATVVWLANAEIYAQQGGAGVLTITGATGVTINGVSGGSFSISSRYAVVRIKRTGSDAWTVSGGLANSLVSGPATAGNGNLAIFDGTTGKLIKDGGVVTAAGLALLDDASADAQRTTLGLGTAATRNALGSTGELYSRDSILGTVSQSGGIPTGAIIERGSNANGEYVRFADGTLEVTKVLTGTFDASTPYGSVFVSSLFQGGDMAATSVSAPAVTITAETSASSSYMIEGESSASSFSGFYITGFVAISGTYRASLTSKGRWF